MKALRLVPIVLLALSGVLATSAGASAAPAPAHHGHNYFYDCTGGDVPPGFYD